VRTTLGPRVVVAGVASGVGKTTVATGLMAALRQRNFTMAAAKVGPDFIDPGYHSIATGRPGRNLDSWICGEAAIPGMAHKAAEGADVLIIEGVMGLFDGAADGEPEASTASIARLLDAPVLLVVDASAISGSVAAMVHGYVSFDPALRVAGVVLNRVGSPGHAELLREALTPLGVPVLGVLPRHDALSWRDRHLGLVPVIEQIDEVRRSIRVLSAEIARGFDLDAVLAMARAAPPLPVRATEARQPTGSARIAVATGPAFDFVYQDNLEALEAAGAELLPFDPLVDASIPEGSTALYAGGGFPEVFAPELARNTPLHQSLRERVARGLVVWAECGGLLWLTQSLDGHRLSGVIAAEGHMTNRLTLGYRSIEFLADCSLGSRGGVLRGHEYHYSTVTPAGSGMRLQSRSGESATGFASERLLASYVHFHLGGDPSPAEHLVAASTRSPSWP
jgi:cobyrinic acid a,c-diamide synthase